MNGMTKEETQQKNLQERMFKELTDRGLFTQAQQYAMDYLEEVLERNVYPTQEALDSLAVFEEDLPIGTSTGKQVLEQLHRFGTPATTATLGGRYFGFVCGSALPIGLAAKSMATFWDQASAMYVMSPISGKLESVVENWLVDLFGLPQGTAAGFVSGTSIANLCGLAAARYRILKNNDWDINQKGLWGAPKIRIVTGRQAHSTVVKALGILGLGQEHIEWVAVDGQGRMVSEVLPELDQNTILILQAGNVNSGAFDDFETLCSKARSANAWIHIDGAFGLWAGAVDQLKHLTKGIELADSWAVDGHKTLNTPYDCGISLCADKEAMRAALHMSGSYLVESDNRDGMFHTPEMSRRARIIELWAILKYLGRQGVDEMIMNMHLRAQQFANELNSKTGFHIENEIVFNQVIVRCDNDVLTEKVLKNIQEMGTCWLGGSTWQDKMVMRVSICSWATTERDITLSVTSFAKALQMALAD